VVARIPGGGVCHDLRVQRARPPPGSRPNATYADSELATPCAVNVPASASARSSDFRSKCLASDLEICDPQECIEAGGLDRRLEACDPQECIEAGCIISGGTAER